MIMATRTQQFMAVSTLALASAGCAVNKAQMPFTPQSPESQDNAVAVSAGIATYAGMRLSGANHPGAAGLLVAAALKVAGSMTAKDYCSTRSVQVGVGRSQMNGVPVNGGIENYTQTDCVQSNLTFRPGDMIPVVYDSSKGPINKADQVFEVIEQRRQIDAASGNVRVVPLVRDVTAGSPNTGKTYLMHAFTREAVNNSTGEKIRTDVMFVNEVNLGNRPYAPVSQQQQVQGQRSVMPQKQCTGLANIISAVTNGDCRAYTNLGY
jgi:hypothetical protein